MPHLAKILIISGIMLIIAGLVIKSGGNKFDWIGHLPGDIRIEKENMKFYFPISTMIIFSAILSIVIWVLKKIS